ncbi:MAG TPA: ABC transporter substrate-binding protein [Mycobacteriales bacterium]|nr:ABC transporter substrate-binding protein [Mycobacteriales bacterium]HWB65234.1 ABC transporter substrate-binding protein [Mycobacteriales bacterium]
MLRASRTSLVGLVALAAVASACSSSSSGGTPSSNSSSTTSAAGTITVGLLTDVTGTAASGENNVQDGVKAGIYVAKQDGYNIKYVVGDTTSTPAGALAAAQKLVNQDHVNVVLASSAMTFGAAQFLAQKQVPVVGAAIDGPEWVSAPNMVSVAGPIDTTKVTTVGGNFFKTVGATNVGSLGYGVSPTSSESAKATAISVQAVGLKAGYTNAKLAFGSTDVQPIALAMKQAGVDALAPQVDPNTSFALVGALAQLGVKIKAVLLPIGYGGDLLNAGAAALQAAQGAYFIIYFEPVEMNTPGTQKFLAALSAVGGTQHPGLPTYTGYTSILLLEAALKTAGANPSNTALITALRGVTNFDAGGLTSKPYTPSDPSNVAGPNNCYYVVQLEGEKFNVVKGLDPVCGTVIAGKTVSAG